MRWAEHVERMWRLKIHTKILIGKPETKGSIGEIKRRWEDNITSGIKKLRYEEVDCIQLVQDMHYFDAIQLHRNNPF